MQYTLEGILLDFRATFFMSIEMSMVLYNG